MASESTLASSSFLWIGFCFVELVLLVFPVMARLSLLILLVIMGSEWATNRKDKRANSSKNKVKGTDKKFGLALPLLFDVIFTINVYFNQ